MDLKNEIKQINNFGVIGNNEVQSVLPNIFLTEKQLFAGPVNMLKSTLCVRAYVCVCYIALKMNISQIGIMAIDYVKVKGYFS